MSNQNRRFLLTAVFLAGLSPALHAQSADSTWRQHDAAADLARAGQDWTAYRHHALELERLLSGHPATIVALAGAAARLGDVEEALARLDQFARMGLVRDLASDSDLAVLRGKPRFTRLVRRVAANGTAIGLEDTAFVLPDPLQVPEDLALDPSDGAWYFSSIRHGGVMRRVGQGRWETFVRPGQDTAWSTMALALDPVARRLWVSTAALPQMEARPPADAGRSAVLAYDLDTGALLRRVEVPRDSLEHVLGDMTLAPDGTLYLSDSRSGAVYALPREASTLRLLVPRGELVSPQGLVPLTDGRRLLVADYVRGIAVVDRSTGKLTFLPHAPEVAVNGIDGLRLAGGALIAVQNGTRPNRVVRLPLDAAQDSITGWSAVESGTTGLMEPTHVVVRAGYLYYIANSGWDALTDDGGFRAGVLPRPAVIRRVRLAQP